MQRGVQVQPQLIGDVRRVALGEGLQGHPAGGVHEQIDPAVRGDHPVHQGRGPGGVPGPGGDLGDPARPGARPGRGRWGRRQIRGEDLGPGGGQGGGHRGADAAAGADHQRHPAPQIRWGAAGAEDVHDPNVSDPPRGRAASPGAGAARGSMTAMDRPAVRDAALLILRLVLGIIFVAHGFDKVFGVGVDATVGYFVAAGIPQATLTVWLVAVVEMVCGALLILGLLAPAVAGVLLIEMAGAFWFVHLGHGLFVADGGAELVLALIAGLVVVVAFGAGRASLDRVFTR